MFLPDWLATGLAALGKHGLNSPLKESVSLLKQDFPLRISQYRLLAIIREFFSRPVVR
jgi:hypothetical protein